MKNLIAQFKTTFLYNLIFSFVGLLFFIFATLIIICSNL